MARRPSQPPTATAPPVDTGGVGAVRVKDATPAQLAVCACDVCGETVGARRGWINPTRAAEVRGWNGGYVHGRCINP